MTGKKIAVFLLVTLIVFAALRAWGADQRPDQDRIQRDFKVLDTTVRFVTGGSTTCPQVTTFDVWVRYFRRMQDGVRSDKNELVWSAVTRDCAKNIIGEDGGEHEPEGLVLRSNISRGLFVLLPGRFGRYVLSVDPNTEAIRTHEGEYIEAHNKHREKSVWYWANAPAVLLLPGRTINGSGELEIKVRNVLRQCIGGC